MYERTKILFSSVFGMISVIPTIQYGPQVFSTIEGTPITLPCRASGVPTPEITWSKVCIGFTLSSIKYANVRANTVVAVVYCFPIPEDFIFPLINLEIIKRE